MCTFIRSERLAIIESQVTFMPNATVSLTEDQTVSLEKMYDAVDA